MRIAALTLVVTFASLQAKAQSGIAQPGQAAQENSEAGKPPRSTSKNSTVVQGALQENDLIGDYAQPRWTAQRLFPTTRIYVVPPESIQLEYWLDTLAAFSSPGDVRFRNLYELELGLGHRLQLDLYVRTEQKGYQGTMELESEKLELRWALADWGKLPGNPTLYFELSRFTEGPATLETKLLLGGNLAARMHWGLNVVFERDLGGSALLNQYGVTAGIAYAVTDRKLSIGAELQFESTDGGRDARGQLDEVKVFAGPSVQWRPVGPVHVDLVALIGAFGERNEAGELGLSAGMRPLLVIGYAL
jgi:hypothetical protein